MVKIWPQCGHFRSWTWSAVVGMIKFDFSKRFWIDRYIIYRGNTQLLKKYLITGTGSVPEVPKKYRYKKQYWPLFKKIYYYMWFTK